MVLLDEFQGRGEEEGERGKVLELRACEADEWSLRAAGARVRASTGGWRRRGTAPGRVADAEAH